MPEGLGGEARNLKHQPPGGVEVVVSLDQNQPAPGGWPLGRWRGRWPGRWCRGWRGCWRSGLRRCSNGSSQCWRGGLQPGRRRGCGQRFPAGQFEVRQRRPGLCFTNAPGGPCRASTRPARSARPLKPFGEKIAPPGPQCRENRGGLAPGVATQQQPLAPQPNRQARLAVGMRRAAAIPLGLGPPGPTVEPVNQRELPDSGRCRSWCAQRLRARAWGWRHGLVSVVRAGVAWCSVALVTVARPAVVAAGVWSGLGWRWCGLVRWQCSGLRPELLAIFQISGGCSGCCSGCPGGWHSWPQPTRFSWNRNNQRHAMRSAIARFPARIH